MGINVRDKYIVINLDAFVKQYFINSSFEYLLGALYQLKPEFADKTIKIFSVNQTPLSLNAFRGVLDDIANIVDLPPEKIILETKDRTLTHNRVTVQVIPDQNFFQFPPLICNELNKLDFKLDPDPVLFGALYGRPSYPRLILAHYLETRYPDQSFVTFLSQVQHIEDNVMGMESVYAEQLAWARQRQTAENTALADSPNGNFCFPKNIQQWPEVWGKYLIEIAVETDYHNPTDWTEKTWKCLGSGKPFISMMGAGSLALLRNMGFETYHSWINEEYDQEPNAWRRLDLVKAEIDRLANLSPTELVVVYNNLKTIADRNISIYNDKYAKH
jgi:hypothetical protein